MKFRDFYACHSPIISFELFPPKTDEGLARLEERIPKLISLAPAFITVTYGALGSTRERTLELVSKIRNVYGHEAAHHLTCVGSTRVQIDELLGQIREHNIENIVALRGDPPTGETEFKPPEGGYAHANELVEHVREFGGFGIAVAGYPEKHLEAPDLETDLRNLKRKVDVGADAVITQLFYDNRSFFEFVERCRAVGIQQPIVPGLLPILNLDQIKRITQICGSRIPKRLLQQLVEAGQDEERVHEVGISYTAGQAVDLLEKGVPGIHFYVLNQHFHIAEVMHRIRPTLNRLKVNIEGLRNPGFPVSG
jgi:methylenetetrahydrofolate reductase (NADPH)